MPEDGPTPPPPGDSGAGSSGPQPSGIELARQALARAKADAKERGANANSGGRGRPSRVRSTRSSRFTADPQPFGAAIRGLLADRGWSDRVAVGGVFGRWDDIVGPRLAEHARPERLEEGELVVVVDSPTWATQIRALSADLLRRLNEELGHGSVATIKVRGPGRSRGGARAWKAR